MYGINAAFKIITERQLWTQLCVALLWLWIHPPEKCRLISQVNETLAQSDGDAAT